MQENTPLSPSSSAAQTPTLASAMASASRKKHSGKGSRSASMKSEPLLFPIALKGSARDQRKLTRIVNEMCKSTAGITILESAAQEGYALRFDRATIEDGIFGYAEPVDKICALNPQNTLEESIVTMAHELRHAYQFEAQLVNEVDARSHDTKTKLMTDRAMEADAESYGCLVAWELKEAGSAQTWNNFKNDFPEIADPFAVTLANGGTMNEARTEAFKGWYDNGKRRDSYDETHLEVLESIAPDRLNKKLKSVPADRIIKAICHDPDQASYFTDDPNIIAGGVFVTVYQDTKQKFQSFFQKRNALKGRIPDTSIEGLPAIPRPKSKKKGKAVSQQAREAVISNKQNKAAQAIRDKKMEKASSVAALTSALQKASGR